MDSTSLLAALVLEKLRFDAGTSVPRSLLDSMEVSAAADFLAHEILIRVKAEFLGERVGMHETIGVMDGDYHVPASWVQFWKHQHRRSWYARWLVNRWPVKWTRIECRPKVRVQFDAYRVFPNTTIDYPRSLGNYIRVVISKPVNFRDYGK
jgi:hypothetical protein